MDWNAFGVVAACAWCGLLLAFGVWKILNAESRCARAEGIGSPERSEPEGPQGAASRRGRREDFELRARPPAPGNLCVSALKQKPLTVLGFLAFAALATVEAQKPGQLRVGMERGEAATATLNSQLSTLNSQLSKAPEPFGPDAL